GRRQGSRREGRRRQGAAREAGCGEAGYGERTLTTLKAVPWAVVEGKARLKRHEAPPPRPFFLSLGPGVGYSSAPVASADKVAGQRKAPRTDIATHLFRNILASGPGLLPANRSQVHPRPQPVEHRKQAEEHAGAEHAHRLAARVALARQLAEHLHPFAQDLPVAEVERP